MSESIQIRRAMSPNIAITKATAPFEVVEAEPPTEPQRRKFSAQQCPSLNRQRSDAQMDLTKLEERYEINSLKVQELTEYLGCLLGEIQTTRDNINRINQTVENEN